jgi:hypothetical protein
VKLKIESDYIFGVNCVMCSGQHADWVLPHWLAILSWFPETTPPQAYQDLLPAISMQGALIPWLRQVYNASTLRLVLKSMYFGNVMSFLLSFACIFPLLSIFPFCRSFFFRSFPAFSHTPVLHPLPTTIQ